MKKELIERVQKGVSAQERFNLLREELHHLILQELDRKGAFSQICFVGGTAARVLFGLDRYSEDLDFSLSQNFKGGFRLEILAKATQKSLDAFGFNCSLNKVRTIKTVQSCFVNFKEILHETDRSFPSNQKLAVKLEVDTNPPAGAQEITSPVAAFRLYKVRHHDLPSLFAGKIAAVLCRKYAKGRDFYDFLWYSARKTPLNLVFLKNSLEQAGVTKIPSNLDYFKKMLMEKFQKTDFAQARKTCAPFLINQDSLDLFDKKIFLKAVDAL
ncbi:MAG: nucleotidyl transferase AbiEii/AbiGii toxin family protein [Elusimicrobia bacterium]|nr:nucleotidyl transferase AbiEii/AbiGii toxin family protein [Elusimicrobiota bacterium]